MCLYELNAPRLFRARWSGWAHSLERIDIQFKEIRMKIHIDQILLSATLFLFICVDFAGIIQIIRFGALTNVPSSIGRWFLYVGKLHQNLPIHSRIIIELYSFYLIVLTLQLHSEYYMFFLWSSKRLPEINFQNSRLLSTSHFCWNLIILIRISITLCFHLKTFFQKKYSNLFQLWI